MRNPISIIFETASVSVRNLGLRWLKKIGVGFLSSAHFCSFCFLLQPNVKGWSSLPCSYSCSRWQQGCLSVHRSTAHWWQVWYTTTILLLPPWFPLLLEHCTQSYTQFPPEKPIHKPILSVFSHSLTLLVVPVFIPILSENFNFLFYKSRPLKSTHLWGFTTGQLLK